MSTHRPEISFIQLYHNVHTVVTQSDSVLTFSLDVEKGSFSNCRHKKILSCALQRLLSSTQPSAYDLQPLYALKRVFEQYDTKLSHLKQITTKTRTKTVANTTQIMGRIFQRLDLLHTAAKNADTVIDPTPLAHALTSDHPDDISTRILFNHVLTTALIWHLFRSVDTTFSLLRAEEEARQAFIDHGGRFVPGGSQFIFMPSSRFFSAPVPVLMLGARIGMMLADIGGTKKIDHIVSQEILDPILVLIRQGQELYPEYAAEFENFLRFARFLEIQHYAGLLFSEALPSIVQAADQIPRQEAGPIIEQAYAAYVNCCKDMEQTQQLQMTHELSICLPTQEQNKHLVAYNVARRKTQQKIIATLSPIVAAFRESLRSIAPSYIQAWSKIRPSKALVLRDEIDLRILKQGGIYTTYGSPRILSPEEYVSFSPIIFPSYAVIGPTHEASASAAPHDIPEQPVTQKKPAQMQPRTKQAPSASCTAAHEPQASTSEGKHHAQSITIEQQAEKARCDENPKLAPQHEKSDHVAAAVQSPTFSSRRAPQTIAPTSSSPATPQDSHIISHPFLFGVGDHVPPSLTFAWHASRWYDASYDPFVSDERYSLREYSQQVKREIRFQHTPPLALLRVVLGHGKQFIDRNAQEESRYLPADVVWDDATYDKGVLTIGRNLRTGVIFHIGFSQLSPTTLEERYLSGDMFQPVIEVGCSANSQKFLSPRMHKELPDDGTYIAEIKELYRSMYGITVRDPVRRLSFNVYIEQ